MDSHLIGITQDRDILISTLPTNPGLTSALDNIHYVCSDAAVSLLWANIG